MKHIKEQLRKTALDIIFKRNTLPSNLLTPQRTLAQAVAEMLAREDGTFDPLQVYRGYDFSEEDKDLFDEVFWDLVIERVIVPGLDIFDAQRSTFRVRSDADPKTK